MSSTTKFDLMASEKYPFTEEMSIPDRRDQLKKRAVYVERLQECRDRPAYHVETILGPLPCRCEPLMEDDTKGWQVVKKKIRVKRAKTHQTYTNVGQAFEHNGALFDIGSRF
jgi:hypothetical protein